MSDKKYKDGYEYIIHIKRHALRKDLYTHIYNIIDENRLDDLTKNFSEVIISKKYVNIMKERIINHGIVSKYGITKRLVTMILSKLGNLVLKYNNLSSQFLKGIILQYLGIELNASYEVINKYLLAYQEKDYTILYSLIKTKETKYNPHQERVRDFFLKYKPRYGILYHEMGSGKTCTATALISAISTLKDIKAIYILVPNSYLVKQFAEDFQYTCSFKYGELWEREELKNMILFRCNEQIYYIMTYVIYSKLVNVDNDSVMIIDEAHNIRSTKDITKLDDSTSQVQLHQSIFSQILTNNMTFKHVFYMTGTPVMNIPNDFIVLLNTMLTLTCQSNKMITSATNTTYKELMSHKDTKTFFDKIPILMTIIDDTLRNTRGFISRVRVQDLSSTLKLPEIDFTNHYYNYSSDFTGGINGTFPEDVYEKYEFGIGNAKPIEIKMSDTTYAELIRIRTNAPDNEKKDTISWGTKDKNIHTARVLCNKDKIPSIISKVIEHLGSKQRSPVLIHTTLKETVTDIQNELLKHNFSVFGKENQSTFKYGVISGDTPDKDVLEIMTAYNNIINIKGDVISVCIITSAAGTGFTFRNTRQLHIVEPYWNFSYLQQVTGRAVRHNVFDDYIVNDTSKNLPPHVKIYAYIATAPIGGKYRTIDEEILDMMREKMRYVETYSSLLYKLSIEYPRSNSNARNFYMYPRDTELFVCNKEIKLLKSVKKPRKNPDVIEKQPKHSPKTKSLFFSPVNKPIHLNKNDVGASVLEMPDYEMTVPDRVLGSTALTKRLANGSKPNNVSSDVITPRTLVSNTFTQQIIDEPKIWDRVLRSRKREKLPLSNKDKKQQSDRVLRPRKYINTTHTVN